MPALITHHLFGEESVTRLPEGIVKDQEELLAFLLGNQGPDPFFFRFSSTPANVMASQRLGSRMHHEGMTRAFEALRTGVSRLPRKDAGIGRAFAFGLLSHYALDRVAHPFVYSQQYALVKASDELDNAGGQVHAIIESDIDTWMLRLKRDTDVMECHPADELSRTARIERVAGALTSQVAWQAFGIELPATEYAGAVGNMETVYRLIEPAGSAGAIALGVAERMARPHSLIQALSHPMSVKSPCDAANEPHHEWHSPFDDFTSIEDFSEVFDRALEGWGPLAEAFAYGGDRLRDAIGGLNYSGRPLGADETCEEDD